MITDNTTNTFSSITNTIDNIIVMALIEFEKQVKLK